MLIISLATASCAPQSPKQPTAVDSHFDHPQAIAFVDGFLVVTSTGYDATQWRNGFISILDPSTQRLVSTHRTSQLNPQRILTTENDVYIINTGTYDFSNFHRPTSKTPGGIDHMPIAQMTTTTDNLTPVSIDLDTLVAPIDGLILDDGKFALTSGLEPKIVLIKEGTTAIRLPTDQSTGLGSMARWRDGFIVVDFNSDMAFFLTKTGQLRCSVHLGEFEAEMEGATSPVVSGGTLYVIMALSGVVRGMALDPADPCAQAPQTFISPLGQVPNDLHIRGNEAWVVNSGDNNVIVYDLETGDETDRLLMPVGSNPWQAAFSADERWLAVTLWASNGISLVDRETGEIRIIHR